VLAVRGYPIWMMWFFKNLKMKTNIAPKIQQKLCLATLSDKEYWPGTKAMLNSFLYHNPWFKGDIVIITNDNRITKKISRFTDAKIIPPSEKLCAAIEDLCHQLPYYKSIKSRLHLFEIFNLTTYNQVIYSDSDIIFRDSMHSNELFKHSFSAVKDPWHYRGFSREKKTFNKIPLTKTDQHNCFTNFFNSGLVCLSKESINPSNYHQLIDNITPEFYRSIQDNTIDEPIINTVFENKISELPLYLNCPTHLIAEHIADKNVKALHFTGNNKPWKVKSWLMLLHRNKQYFNLLTIWFRAYLNIF
jgi:lipopolysaccharide biosynthesis glycosyltransferase